jgi:uncharacterized membrane protein
MEAARILMATFPSESGADEAVTQLEAMAKAGSIEILEAAVVSRDSDGNPSVRQVNLPRPRSWAGKGALVGGIIGLIFPPTIIGTALVGAGLGAGTAAIARHALKNEELEEAAADLEPGTSAFIAVIDEVWVKEAAKAMAGYQRLAEHALDADTTANLGLISDEAAGIASATAEMTGVDEEGNAVAASLESVTDLDTGATITTGALAVSDGDDVVVSQFAEVDVPDEVPDAMGGYEASLEAGEDEDGEGT